MTMKTENYLCNTTTKQTKHRFLNTSHWYLLATSFWFFVSHREANVNVFKDSNSIMTLYLSQQMSPTHIKEIFSIK